MGLGGVDRPARCLFCGAIGVWWSCGCEWARLIEAGKLAKPRTVVKGGVAVIELCEELRSAARAAGVITREYGRGDAPNRGVERSDETGKVRETAKVSVSPGANVSSNVSSVSTCAVCGKKITGLKLGARYCSSAEGASEEVRCRRGQRFPNGRRELWRSVHARSGPRNRLVGPEPENALRRSHVGPLRTIAQ